MVKTNVGQAPSFYQPQNDAGRYDAAFGGGSFRSIGQVLSSSDENEQQDVDKKLMEQKNKRRRRSSRNSSDYSHSSEDGLVGKPPAPATLKVRRTESQDQIHRVARGGGNAAAGAQEEIRKSNRSVSFGNSDCSNQLSTSDKDIGSD